MWRQRAARCRWGPPTASESMTARTRWRPALLRAIGPGTFSLDLEKPAEDRLEYEDRQDQRGERDRHLGRDSQVSQQGHGTDIANPDAREKKRHQLGKRE